MWSGGRAGAALAVAVACLGVAPGCGPAADGARPIELWAMGREGEMVERLVPAFERAHPGLRVRVQQIPWSAAHEKLLTAYVGEALPDVVQVGSTWVPELTALGALVPLDDRLAASSAIRRDDYFAGILDTHVVEGRTMAVPWYVDTRVFFYRTDLLRLAGAAAPPETWADWLAAMQRLVHLPDRHAIFLPVTDWVMPVVIALQHGAQLLRGDAEYGNFRSPTMRDAFTFYLRLFQRGLAPAGGTDVVNVHQDFARGYFAVYPSGPWDLGEFARRLPPALASAWATAPMPGRRPGEIGRSLAGGAGLAITAQAAQPDAAWTLVEWLSAPAQQVAFHRLTGDLPARRSAWDEAGLRNDTRTRAFWTQLDHLAATPKIAEWERIATAIGRTGERIVRAGTRVEPALADLDREVDAILEKRRWLLARGRGRG
jgi:multiple sugar transport system substrate-binding protein